MELLSRKCVFIFLWCVSLFLLFPVLLGIDVTSSSIYIDNRYIDDNGDIRETYISKDGNNSDRENDVIDDSRGDRSSTNTASEKFLESLRQKCKKHKSFKLICSSLRLVLPITRPYEPISASGETKRNSYLENIKLKKRFTQPSELTETETYIVRPEEHEATTELPMKGSYVSLRNHKSSPMTTNRDKLRDIIPAEPNGPYAPSHTLPNLAYQNRMMTHNFETNIFRKNDNSDVYSHETESNIEEKYGSKRSDVAHNLTYQTEFVTDNSAGNVWESNISEQTAYSGPTGSDGEDENDGRKPEESRNIAYQNHIMTDKSEDVFRKMDRSEQTAHSDHTEINSDYDETKEREQDVGYEMGDEDTRNCLHKDEDIMEGDDKVTCSVAKSSTENVSERAGEEGDGGKLDNMMDRFIDDSVKIFKNSFTIKFPTFERITNKIFEWFQIVFGTKTRDEARGKLKKILNPIILGLAMKGVIVLASVTGLIMKAIAAKTVLIGLATVVFTAVAIFRKYSAPQGGTIYVHTNGGAGHKNGAYWDKEGYGHHRISKDASGYQVWENDGRRQRGDYSTPPATGDRYYQHYNSYYRPNSATYSTTMSPYIA